MQNDPAPWQTLESKPVYRSRWAGITVDTVQLPTGATYEYTRIERAGVGVGVIGRNAAGELLLEREYRHGVGEVVWQIPGGLINEGEDLQTAGLRELHEETGYRAARWARAGVMHPVIGYATEVIEIWFADGLTLEQRHLDQGEFLDVFAASQEELEAWMQAGQLTDAKTIVGMMWLQRWRSGHCQLDWQTVD